MRDLLRVLVAFDLDDTLYKERDYVESGYLYVARKLARQLHVPVESTVGVVLAPDAGKHPFDALFDYLDGAVSVERMVGIYREHMPYLVLPSETRKCLERLLAGGVRLALITDGRHVGQWNKIHALGLERYFNKEFISISDDVGYDKNHIEPWLRMESLTPDCDERWYIGDNPRKDFRFPRSLGWHTVMLVDDGRNIKTQHVDLPDEFYAEMTIKSLDSLPDKIFFGPDATIS